MRSRILLAGHGAGVGIGCLYGRAGKDDKGGIRQRVVHVPREVDFEVVRDVVRLVGDHDNVAPLAEHRVRSPVSRLVGEQHVDNRGDYVARGDGPLGVRVGAVGKLPMKGCARIKTEFNVA